MNAEPCQLPELHDLAFSPSGGSWKLWCEMCGPAFKSENEHLVLLLGLGEIAHQLYQAYGRIAVSSYMQTD